MKDIMKNIVGKIIEKEIKYKYILSIMIVVLIFFLSNFAIDDDNNMLRYADFPTLLFVGILPFFIVCILFGFSKTKIIFSVPFMKEHSEDLLNESLLFFNVYNKIIWHSTLLVIIVNCMEILLAWGEFSVLDMDYKTILAITLISPLYAVLINLTVIIPYNIIIKRQINNQRIEN